MSDTPLKSDPSTMKKVSSEASSATDFDVQRYLSGLTSRPGIYRMLNEAGDVLYVGKARNLKKRVSSYFSRQDKSPKTRVLVAQIKSIEVTVTHTENEALILENNLIKELKPRYNILLRDDKSYPHIFLSTRHDFPQLSYHRGAKREKGRYFGPYPSAGAVRETLNLLQKLFQVRQCDDSFFSNRSRPCLQYQIKRCSAPCVDKISNDDYQKDVRHAVMFLEGKDSLIIDEQVKKMERASEQLEFEKAAQFRDQISSLRKVQEKQYISAEKGNIDVIACLLRDGVGCVEVFFIRAGHNLGNKYFFPRHPAGTSPEEILSAFLSQYYLGRFVPNEIIVNCQPEGQDLLEEVLADSAGHKVKITGSVKADRARWLAMATINAEQDLERRLSSKASLAQRYISLQEGLELDSLPTRMECFDISHTSGEATVASCVVFNADGALKQDYRRFNIEDVTAGDDYAAIKQALMRRYTRLKKGEGKLPDVLFIDGGKGQVKQAETVLEELQINGVTIIGIAKGVERKAGDELLFNAGLKREFRLASDSPALHLIQQIRDEAHRFAITGHRQRRSKTRNTSVLEGISGVGAGRRRLLLNQFGGLQGISSAGVEDLANVKGINKQLAQRIYDTFHVDQD